MGYLVKLKSRENGSKMLQFFEESNLKCFIAQKTRKKHEKKFPDELRNLFLRMK